ncbi:hypothetical protein LTR78_007933 [Recurvomyces mirabilis]|uniref:Uncharacterized protein n=1 Tax=Recurvomyces mirabilis TaxID=574656 RepID=A0AAE0WHW6_9PEZI|nr:hypothetical protein LTR78_007933 [Recurvomyces mirabilis]KAK5152469.1 hypothetical protein LTS14_008416 [Recurvomyces mirabilis]
MSEETEPFRPASVLLSHAVIKQCRPETILQTARYLLGSISPTSKVTLEEASIIPSSKDGSPVADLAVASTDNQILPLNAASEAPRTPNLEADRNSQAGRRTVLAKQPIRRQSIPQTTTSTQSRARIWIGPRLGKSLKKGVASQLKREGLTVQEKHSEPWTSSELEFAQTMEGTITSAQIAIRLGKSPAKAVDVKLDGEHGRVGLTEKPMATRNTWCADELEQALSWTATMTYAEIAEKLGRPNVSTVQRRLEHELPDERKRPRAWAHWPTKGDADRRHQKSAARSSRPHKAPLTGSKVHVRPMVSVLAAEKVGHFLHSCQADTISRTSRDLTAPEASLDVLRLVAKLALASNDGQTMITTFHISKSLSMLRFK